MTLKGCPHVGLHFGSDVVCLTAILASSRAMLRVTVCKSLKTLRFVRHSAMTVTSALRDLANTLKYSKKSDKSEFMLYMKLVVLGVAVVGGLAFVIHLISTLVTYYLSPKLVLGLADLVI